MCESVVELSIFQQSFGRDAAPVEAGAASAVRFDDCDFFSELSCADCSNVARRAAANDDEIVCHDEMIYMVRRVKCSARRRMSKLRSNKMHKSGDSRIGKRPVADLESLMMQQGDQFDATRCVSFSDTDASGRVHFTAILRYVEDAEHLFFASLGIAVIGGNHGWPRVHIDCDYRAPLTFGDEVQIRLVVQVVGKSSVKYTFAVKKFDQLCAEGSMVIVRVDG